MSKDGKPGDDADTGKTLDGQPAGATDDDSQADRPRIVPPESVPPVSAEELVDGDLPGPEDEPERRYPSTIGGAFYLVVLATVIGALVVVSVADWRLGVKIMGGALGVAAVIRLILPARDAGMLAVRHKALDAAILVLLGGGLIFLAYSIPEAPGF